MNTSLFGIRCRRRCRRCSFKERQSKAIEEKRKKGGKTQIIQKHTQSGRARVYDCEEFLKFFFSHFEMANGIRIETGILQLISISKNKRFKLTVNWKLGQ